MTQDLSYKKCSTTTIPSIEHNGIRYSSPDDEIGYIIATDIKTEKTVWTRQIYKALASKLLSPDSKGSIIKKIKLKDNELKIYNDKKETIYLDLGSRKVTKFYAN